MVAVFLAFVVTVLFMFVLRPLAFAVGLVDIPGGRKKHGVAVPVIGGIAMSIGLGFGTSLVSQPESWSPILLGVYLLAVVGTIDDRFDLPANVRLIAQSCAALLVIFASGVAVLELGEFFGFTLSPRAPRHVDAPVCRRDGLSTRGHVDRVRSGWFRGRA